jgi:pathogenesis-related protein 1
VLTAANFAPTGHYTQMVWRSTTQVGMGQASCPGGALVIVAEYNPPGNYIGQKPY